jgi:pimeloyl-ACP methyl ester carboxylesterase
MRHTNLFSGLTFARLISLGSTRKADVLNKRQFLPEDPFDWSTIEPSADIEYHDCYDDLRCARLLVPLDWSKHNSTEALDLDETAAIAIVKIPASVPETDPSFGGPILYNPGGPAVSGASRVREEGKTLQSLFDGDKHFDIIGFDPRGVGATTPPIRCYQDETKRWTAVDILGGLPPVGSGPVTLQYHLQTFKAFWDICEEASLNNTVFPHVATASVARDMLEIVDKVEASKPHCSNSSGSRGKHEAKLQYYGQSYGTYLGATFASMFPDRVGLMVLDSVVDADGWNRGVSIRRKFIFCFKWQYLIFCPGTY